MDKGNWTYRKLGEVAESELGKTLDSKKNTGNLNPYLCAVNVQWDRFELDALKEMKFEEWEKERYSIREGDLVVCEGGDIGRCAIWNKKETVLYQNALHRVRFNGEMLPRFCMYFLMNLKKSGELDAKYGKGVTIKHLVKSSLLSIPVPIPPLPIQQRIVAELDCISSILEKKRQQLKELDNLAQAIFYDMFGDPVENEKGWEVKKLDEVCDVRDGTHDSPKFIDGGKYILITSKNIVNGKIDYSNISYITKEDYDAINKRSKVDDGDIIMAMIGTIGKPIIVKKGNRKFCIKNVALIKFLKDSLVSNIFVQALLSSSSFSKYIMSKNKGVTQKFVALGTIRKLEIPIPPLSLQQSFAAKIEAIEKQKERISQSIKEVQTLFDSRMQEYFG